jgi:hypothetical protein
MHTDEALQHAPSSRTPPTFVDYLFEGKKEKEQKKTMRAYLLFANVQPAGWSLKVAPNRYQSRVFLTSPAPELRAEPPFHLFIYSFLESTEVGGHSSFDVEGLHSPRCCSPVPVPVPASCENSDHSRPPSMDFEMLDKSNWTQTGFGLDVATGETDLPRVVSAVAAESC